MGEGGIMSIYLARLKEIESEKNFNISSASKLTKLTEVPFDGFVSSNPVEIKKNCDIAELQAEERRLKVLTMLKDNPDKDRAYVTDAINDSDNVILTIAIRELATFEILIPRSKYDPFLLMELIDGGQIQ